MSSTFSIPPTPLLLRRTADFELCFGFTNVTPGWNPTISINSEAMSHIKLRTRILPHQYCEFPVSIPPFHLHIAIEVEFLLITKHRIVTSDFGPFKLDTKSIKNT